MLSPLRNRFGIPGVISVIALVFAMFGGAYAASNSSDNGKATASAKAKKKGPRGPKGATGPAGPAGPAGPTGAKGDNGANGSNGAAGTSVSTASFSGSKGPCAEGGVEVKSASPTVNVCNGLEGEPGAQGAQGAPGTPGSPWVAGQAPSKVVLKGTWSIPQYTAAAASEKIAVPISTGVPIPSGALIGFAVGAGIVNESPLAAEVCQGSAEEPSINVAFLEGFGIGGVCLYAQEQTNLGEPSFENGDFRLTSSGAGTVVLFPSKATGNAQGFGSWALFTP